MFKRVLRSYHETISINDILPEQDGYILAYLSNENQEAVNIHWDDFTVYHGKTNVVSTQDYYPFGLTFNESVRVASTEQRFKYNGKELQDDTRWLDYGARMYDAAIGRWHVIDPKAEIFLSWSPYNYALNNPIRYEDIGGKGPGDRVKNAKKAVQNDVRTYKQVNGEASRGDKYVDCSEFCREVAEADGYDPGRTSRDQAAYYKKNGEYSTDISDVEVGDFLFWKKQKDGKISHTGIAIAKDENGRFTIAQAGLQNGGKSINAKYKTSVDGTLWKGTKFQLIFVGTGRPDENTPSLEDKINVLSDKISSKESSINRLKKRREKRLADGKSVGNLDNRIGIQKSILNIYNDVMSNYKSQQSGN